MADERTTITELGTAAGMMLGEAHADLSMLEAVEIPGVTDDQWRSVLTAAAEDWHRCHRILKASLANGAAFRSAVLRGRDPDRIDWRGGQKTMWVSDAPVDLRINDVYLVSAKYDSVCLLNRAPSAVFDDLLVRSGSRRAPHWYETVAPGEYDAFYKSFVDALREEVGEPPWELSESPSGLSAEDKTHLKFGTKHWGRTMPPLAAAAYESLCSAVSTVTAEVWMASLNKATEATKLGMLAQMVRICGSVYWLLGQSGDTAVRCRVADSMEFRNTYRLAAFEITTPPAPGQPRVDWRAVLEPRKAANASEVAIEGFCEIRWSHGKFQGNPECKVQLKTPVRQLPGYSSFAKETSQLF